MDRTETVRAALSNHEKELRLFVERRAGGLLDSNEILQTAALRALAKAEQLADPSRARAWLYRIVRNLIADELRRLGVGPMLESIDETELAAEVDEAEACWCVLAQCQTLKPEYAEILNRVVVDGVPVTSLATDLGLTPNNAMVRLSRARAALRKRMQEHCGTSSMMTCGDCGCLERGCCPAPIEEPSSSLGT